MSCTVWVEHNYFELFYSIVSVYSFFLHKQPLI